MIIPTTPTAYAGIGSRETPADVLDLMTTIAAHLGVLGWRLRSGGAQGADTAFAEGAWRVAAQAGALPDVFVPWQGFSRSRFGGEVVCGNDPKATAIAARHHPGWAHLARGARALHTRNVFQVLGRDLASPSAFVVCWTKDGAEEKTSGATGGTGQAIRIAVAYGVPVYNLARPERLEAWQRLVRPAPAAALHCPPGDDG